MTPKTQQRMVIILASILTLIVVGLMGLAMAGL